MHMPKNYEKRLRDAKCSEKGLMYIYLVKTLKAEVAQYRSIRFSWILGLITYLVHHPGK